MVIFFLKCVLIFLISGGLFLHTSYIKELPLKLRKTFHNLAAISVVLGFGSVIGMVISV